MNINTVILVGRAGRHPEIKYYESGKTMAHFSLAVDRRRQSPDEETETDWFKIELWGRQAEIAHEYIKKGSLVGVKGRIEFKNRPHPTGNLTQPSEVPVIRCYHLRLLGGKRDIVPPSGQDPLF